MAALLKTIDDQNKADDYRRLARILTSRVIQIRSCAEGLTSGYYDPVRGYQCDSKVSGYHELDKAEEVACQPPGGLPIFESMTDSEREALKLAAAEAAEVAAEAAEAAAAALAAAEEAAAIIAPPEPEAPAEDAPAEDAPPAEE